MNDRLVIRPMVAADAEATSRMIVRAARETNARDYAPDFIERLVAKNSPAKVAASMAVRQVLVACRGGEVVGTASLGVDRINKVFVSPDHQGHGIGTALMGAVEDLARGAGWVAARLNATLTAEPFYARLGYRSDIDAPLARHLGLWPMEKALVEDATPAPRVTIRTMRTDDAATVAALIARTVRESNAADYPPDSIEAIAGNFTSAKVRLNMAERHVLVAERDGRILGTGSLGRQHLNSLFVAPDRQRGGVGRRLVAVIEELARREGRGTLALRSSFTAVGFYRRLGYAPDPTVPLPPDADVVPMQKSLG